VNGVHDMGGMHGFGLVIREEHEPLYHAEWEARVQAIMRFAIWNGAFNLDAFRYGIEQMDPAHYLRSTYYERWLATIEYNLIKKGIVSAEELDAWTEQVRREPDTTPPATTDAPSWGMPVFGTEAAEPIAPRFAVGDAVVARNINPQHHTRLPRYVRGKRGTINIVHGPEVFADTNAHDLGKNPQVVYSVRFDARELWGDSAEPNQTVSIDLWESYLEPA
jgi:nitrile hydratase beta subunit